MASDKTIMRVQKNKDMPYVMINKEFINDMDLSFKAKGILLYLLSKPDNWRIMVCDLISASKDGETAVRAGIKELINCGYIEKKVTRTNKGRFEKFEYIIYETKQTIVNSSDEPIIENHKMESSTKEKPFVENLNVEKLNLENRGLINNYINNNDLLNNNKNNNNQFGENQDNQINNTEQNNVVGDDVKELKGKIDKKIGSISWKGFNYLLLKSDKDTINYYLDNWSKFKGVDMKSKQGFFISAVINKYTFPEKQQGEQPERGIYKPPQALNYEQREYDDEFFDSLYCNLEFIK